MDFWQCYRAMDARDVRFDGQFITAVSSTGIYCRPSCPARTPKPANVRFYRSSAAAHDAGYRACKRCLPETVPGNPEWNLRGDAAARAMRLILDGEVERSGVSGLAARLGYSPRHLNRLLRDEVGAGALALARAHRAQTARTLLTSTSLRLGDVAFAAGFGSIRQFNETMQQIFGVAPGVLRDGFRRGAAINPQPTPGDPVRLSLTLPVRLPYDGRIFRFLAAERIGGTDCGTGTTYERILRLPGGPARVRASGAVDEGRGRGLLPVTITITALQDLPGLLGRIRRCFDLDADPVAVDAALVRDPWFRALAQDNPGVRIPGSLDPFETLMRAVVGTWLRAGPATRVMSRLAAAAPRSVVAGSLTEHTFPTPEELLTALDLVGEVLGGLPGKAGILADVASGVASGEVVLDAAADAATLRSELLNVPGVEPSVADTVLLRVGGHPDIALPTATHPDLHKAMTTIRPWRSYATAHLLHRAVVPASAPVPEPRKGTP